MIINYSRQFTFVHCPKTAGSSVALYLARHLGPWDIQIGNWEECVEAGIRPNLRFYADVFGPRRLVSSLSRMARERPAITALSMSQKKRYRRELGVQPAHAHADAIRAFDPEAWERHFKFCFVRNPYSRLVSYWRWHEGNRAAAGREQRSFLQFLQHLSQAGRSENVVPDTYEMYTIGGAVAVDFIGRFENLQDDMRTICERLSIPFDASAFPHAKKGEGLGYREFYGPEEREIADGLARREAEMFGYSF